MSKKCAEMCSQKQFARVTLQKKSPNIYTYVYTHKTYIYTHRERWNIYIYIYIILKFKRTLI